MAAPGQQPHYAQPGYVPQPSAAAPPQDAAAQGYPPQQQPAYYPQGPYNPAGPPPPSSALAGAPVQQPPQQQHPQTQHYPPPPAQGGPQYQSQPPHQQPYAGYPGQQAQPHLPPPGQPQQPGLYPPQQQPGPYPPTATGQAPGNPAYPQPPQATGTPGHPPYGAQVPAAYYAPPTNGPPAGYGQPPPTQGQANPYNMGGVANALPQVPGAAPQAPGAAVIYNGEPMPPTGVKYKDEQLADGSWERRVTVPVPRKDGNSTTRVPFNPNLFNFCKMTEVWVHDPAAPVTNPPAQTWTLVLYKVEFRLGTVKTLNGTFPHQVMEAGVEGTPPAAFRTNKGTRDPYELAKSLLINPAFQNQLPQYIQLEGTSKGEIEIDLGMVGVVIDICNFAPINGNQVGLRFEGFRIDAKVMEAGFRYPQELPNGEATAELPARAANRDRKKRRVEENKARKPGPRRTTIHSNGNAWIRR